MNRSDKKKCCLKVFCAKYLHKFVSRNMYMTEAITLECPAAIIGNVDFIVISIFQ